MAIGAVRGTYPGAPTSVGYQVELVDLTRPSGVTLSGRPLRSEPAGSAAAGWYYLPGTSTVVVNTPSLPTTRAVTVVATGGRPVDRPEPPPASS